jgi:hypothetical protein
VIEYHVTGFAPKVKLYSLLKNRLKEILSLEKHRHDFYALTGAYGSAQRPAGEAVGRDPGYHPDVEVEQCASNWFTST